MTRAFTVTQRMAKLQTPDPGQTVTIPLDLLPIYLSVNRLQAMDRGQVHDMEQRTGTRKAPGVVWVKRADGGPG